jgi:hypothetical protein
MVELTKTDGTITKRPDLSSQTVETTDTGQDDVLMSTQLGELVSDVVADQPAAETTHSTTITAFDIFNPDQENAGIEDEVEIQLLWEEADAGTKDVKFI